LITYNPYIGQTEPEGIDLYGYAKSWVDMVPHVDQLKGYASEAHRIIEFGLRGGVSTWALLDGLPANGSLIGVDIDPGALIAKRVREDPRFTFIVGDSVKVKLPSAGADLVMIDSSHEYDQTVEELKVADRLAPKRIILHDYLYHDTPAVKRAVDGFVAFGDYKIEVVHPSSWGLAVLVLK